MRSTANVCVCVFKYMNIIDMHIKHASPYTYTLLDAVAVVSKNEGRRAWPTEKVHGLYDELKFAAYIYMYWDIHDSQSLYSSFYRCQTVKFTL